MAFLSRSSCFGQQHFLSSLRPKPNGRRFADNIFKSIFMYENCCLLIRLPLKFVSRVPINGNDEMVQIMAWRQTVDNTEIVTGPY